MPRRTLLIVLALILASLAIFLTGVYLNQQRQVVQVQAKEEILRAQAMQSQVLVAKDDIAKGAAIEAEMLESKTVPKEYLQPQSVGYTDRIVGMVTLAPISKGEQITLTKLASSRKASASSLAMATPVGKRAISIPVDNISSLMGMIRPGDYVDVIGTVPVPAQTADGKQVMQMAVVPLFQNVLVLAVGRDLGALTSAEGQRYQQDTGSTVPMITLALSPQEASLIAFIQEQGKVRLVLRSPADSRIEPVQPASWETLFQYLMPRMPQQEERATKQESSESQVQFRPREIEIYRGLKRETIPVSLK